MSNNIASLRPGASVVKSCAAPLLGPGEKARRVIDITELQHEQPRTVWVASNRRRSAPLVPGLQTRPAYPPPPMYGDEDDRQWLVGTTYLNRDDPRVLVPKKLDTDFERTLNLGHPVSWILISVPILVALLATITRAR